MRRRTFALALPLPLGSGLGGAQAPLAAPSGAVLLSVGGRIQLKKDSKVLVLVWVYNDETQKRQELQNEVTATGVPEAFRKQLQTLLGK